MAELPMQLVAMIAGLDHSNVIVTVDPYASIATLFKLLTIQLETAKLPHVFTAAYALPGSFAWWAPDAVALARGDPSAVAKYLTPAARLDPKTNFVADCCGLFSTTVTDVFGTHVLPNRVSIVLTCATATIVQQKEQRERERRTQLDQRHTPVAAPTPRAPPASERTPLLATEVMERPTSKTDAVAAGAAARSVWPWAASCWPLVGGACGSEVVGAALDDDDAKKHD